MKLRLLAVLALLGILIPVWAGEVITHDLRINRQRITTVLNAPGGVPVMPQVQECMQNRQRITTIYDIPGSVRDALPVDPQLDRRLIDTTPRPGAYNGKRIEWPMPSTLLNGNRNPSQPGRITTPPKIDNKPPKAIDKEEVKFQVPAKDEPKATKDAPKKDKEHVEDDRARVIHERLTLVDWRCGRQMRDDKGRVWHLIQGTPQIDKPTTLDGWMMQAEDSPIYFFSKTGRMWRLVSLPLPLAVR